MMRVTVLAENSALPGLECEHGLSLHVRTDHKEYLVDMGMSDLFLRNAARLGISAEHVDAAFLSHAHYDHTGGLAAFFRANDHAPVYVRPQAFEKHYGGEDLHANGMDPLVIEAHQGRFRCVREAFSPAEGILLVPHSTEGLREIGRISCLYRDAGQGIEPDDFAHEMTVVFLASQGLVLLSSCSHAGIEAVIREVAACLPGQRIHAVIGGLHLMSPRTGRLLYTEREVRSLGRRLSQMDIAHIVTGHCTGTEAFRILREELGSRCLPLSAGMVIDLKD